VLDLGLLLVARLHRVSTGLPSQLPVGCLYSHALDHTDALFRRGSVSPGLRRA